MGLKTIKGVLHNFLGAYTSRNSDYDGYWLMGLLVRDLQEFKIDLLSVDQNIEENSPVSFAAHLARKLFREQMEKADLSLARVREAQLNITKLPESQNSWINQRECIGNGFRFDAKVVTVTGKTYEDETALVAAPHDADVERRSVRRLKGS